MIQILPFILMTEKFSHIYDSWCSDIRYLIKLQDALGKSKQYYLSPIPSYKIHLGKTVKKSCESPLPRFLPKVPTINLQKLGRFFCTV